MEEPIDGLNSSERKIQDLSMQLLDYYDDRKLVNKKQEKFDEFDSTYKENSIRLRLRVKF